MIAMIASMIALMPYVAIPETTAVTIRIFHFVSINFLAYPYGIR